MNNMQDWAIELKVATFCGVVAGLSMIFATLANSKIGTSFVIIAVMTGVFSLSIYFYRKLFGDLGIIMWIFFGSLLMGIIGMAFSKSEIFAEGLGISLACLAVKAALKIFSKRDDSQE